MIVDVEGSGEMRLLHAEPNVLTVREGEPPKLFSVEFADGSIVLANGPGLVNIQVGQPSFADLGGLSTLNVALPYTGCGWVVQGPSDLIVDDRHEFAPLASYETPVPFFTSLAGSGKATIVVDALQQCRLVEAFDIWDKPNLARLRFKVQSMSSVVELDSTFADGERRKAGVACHLNAAQFDAAIPPENHGLRLRKIYDRFHGRQRARVMVDGQFVGWWFEGGEDRKNRWHVSDFGIPAEITQRLESVRITIDPPAGVALWSVSRMEIFALLPTDHRG